MIKKSGFQRTGAATVGYFEDEEVFSIQMGLGGHAEEYDGEMAAVMMAATRAVEFTRNHDEIQHIHFFSDSTATVGSIFDPKPQSGQHYSHTFHFKIKAFLDANPTATVTINWCPAHQDIVGPNEKADKLAKEATNLACTLPVGVTRSNAMRRARNAPLKLWLCKWEKCSMEGRYAISNCIPPSLKTTLHF
jgi:ribonuclease HI